MSAETALYKAKSVLEDNDALATMLATVDSERSRTGRTPAPQSFKIGSYIGREDILAELPAVTLEVRSSTLRDSQEPWLELEHSVWVWAFVAEVDVELLYLWCLRYGESLRRVLNDRALWTRKWHDVSVGTTQYTGVFQAGHRLVQGCRVEVRVREYLKEATT